MSQVTVGIRELKAHAYAVLERLAIVFRVETEDGHLAARPGTKSLENLDRRRFTGSVRS